MSQSRLKHTKVSLKNIQYKLTLEAFFSSWMHLFFLSILCLHQLQCHYYHDSPESEEVVMGEPSLSLFLGAGGGSSPLQSITLDLGP